MSRVLEHSKREKAVGGVLVAALASVGLFCALKYHLFHELELRTWDWRLKSAALDRFPNPAIKVLLIDQASIDLLDREEHETWPWPRAVYAPVLRYLAQAGAKGAAFDMLFTEESSRGPDDDQEFADAHAGLKVVHAVIPTKQRPANQITPRGDLFSALGGRRLPAFPFMRGPIRPLAEAASGFGAVNAEPDPDGIFRHVRTAAWAGKALLLPLPFALYEAVTHDHRALSRAFTLSGPAGETAIRFHGKAFRTIPIINVFRSYQALQDGREPLVPLAEFKDAWVLIGMSAPGLRDLGPNPLDEKAPGVVLHANVLDNLLTDSFIEKLEVFDSVLICAAFIAAVVFSILALERLRFQAAAGLAVLAAYTATTYAFAHRGLWMPLAVPILALIFSALLAQALQYYLEGRAHRFLRGAFQHYVSPAVIERLVADPSRLSLGGERRELTILFSDIAGFTSISETLEAADLASLLNVFLSEMTNIILALEGTVDKYVGDAIVAFWNAPLAVRDHESRAVLAALQCQRRLAELRPVLQARFGVQLKMRVGLNTGEVSVGNFGSQKRFNYTMIGDAANLASRLEGANKVFGTDILVSRATVARCTDSSIRFRRIGWLRVVGKNEAVEVFEPYDPAERPEVEERRDAYEAALRCFEQANLEQAKLEFARLLGDRVAEAYLKRLEDAARAESFDPVWDLDRK